MKPATKTIADREITPEVGSYVILDSSKNNIGEHLLEGDDYCDSGFPGCQFRFPNPVREWRTSRAIACNVEITGRTVQYRWGGRFVRVLIEWVGDCEASRFSGGWMAV